MHFTDPRFNFADPRQQGYATMEAPRVLVVNSVVHTILPVVFNLRDLCHKLRRYGAAYNCTRFRNVSVRNRDLNTTLFIYAGGKIVCNNAYSLDQAAQAIAWIKALLQQCGYPVFSDESRPEPAADPRLCPERPRPAAERLLVPRVELDADDTYMPFLTVLGADRNQAARERMAAQSNSGALRAAAFERSGPACIGITTTMMVGSTWVGCNVDLDYVAARFSEFVTYNPDRFSGLKLALKSLHPVVILVYKSGKLVVTGGRSAAQLQHAMDETHALLRSCSKEDSDVFSTWARQYRPDLFQRLTASQQPAGGAGTKRRRRPAASTRKRAAASVLVEEPDDVEAWLDNDEVIVV